MAAYEEEQIEFSILGLVRDPLPGLIQELAVNVRRLEVINERLMTSGVTDTGADSSMETSQSLEAPQETLLGPEPFYGLTRAMIDEAVIPEESSEEQIPSFLVEKRDELRQAQTALRGRVREEKQMRDADDDHATGRRYDYGPAIRTWLRCLARKQELAELLS